MKVINHIVNLPGDFSLGKGILQGQIQLAPNAVQMTMAQLLRKRKAL